MADLAMPGPDLALTQVVVIAGGKAKRLGLDRPKCLLEIGGRSLIQISLQSLRAQGFSDFVLLLGHQHGMISSHLRDLGLEAGLKYSIDPPSADGWGKGKAFKYALEKGRIDCSKRAMIVFPDDIILEDSVHSRLLSWHQQAVLKRGAAASLVLVPEIRVPYGIAEVDQDGTVRKFEEKPMLRHASSVGIYLFEPAVYDIIRQKISLDDPSSADLESAVLPELTSRRQLSAMFVASDKWLPINTAKEYEAAKKLFAKEEK